jgi:hypothetical protein
MSQSDYIKQKRIANIISTKGSGTTLNRRDFPQVFGSQVYTDYLQKNAIESVSNSLPTYNQLAVSGTTTVFDMPLQLAGCANSGFCFHEEEDDLVRRFNQSDVGTFLDDDEMPVVQNVVPYVKDIPVVEQKSCASNLINICSPQISQNGNILTASSILSSSGKTLTYKWSDGTIYKIEVSPSGFSSVQHMIDVPGDYYVTVSYKYLSVTSNVITVAQEITNVDITRNANTLSVSADFLFSDTSVTYQWYKNGAAISGASSSSYDTNAISGSYTVSITSYGVSITSAANIF